LSVYDLWLIVICLYNRVILDDFIPEFCNFEVGHSRILQFSLRFLRRVQSFLLDREPNTCTCIILKSTTLLLMAHVHS